MHAARDSFVLHLALQSREQGVKLCFAFTVNAQLGPGPLGVDQPGQRHFVGIRPALHLRQQYVCFLRGLVPRLQAFHAVMTGLAKPFVVVAPIEVQFVEQGDVGGCIDGIELAAERCA